MYFNLLFTEQRHRLDGFIEPDLCARSYSPAIRPPVDSRRLQSRGSPSCEHSRVSTYTRSVYSWQPIVDTLRNLAFGANDRNAQLLSTIDIGVKAAKETYHGAMNRLGCGLIPGWLSCLS